MSLNSYNSSHSRKCNGTVRSKTMLKWKGRRPHTTTIICSNSPPMYNGWQKKKSKRKWM